jgi:Recombinase
MEKNKVLRGRTVGSYEVSDELRQRIVKMYKSGLTLLDIALKLTEEGTPTARGRKWYQGTIRTILHQMGVSTGRYKVPDFIRDIIIEMHSQGSGYNQIAKFLTEQGFKNTRGKKRWHASTVSRIIRKDQETKEE